jgi:ribosomal-protein-alanine N-acetyltransferase
MAFTLLALAQKRSVGFAMLGQSHNDDFHLRIYELLAIAVEPGMQNRGIGSQLLDSIERKAQDLEVEMLILHTAADNLPGHGLFRKFGFISSETKGGFYPAGQDALMMYKRFP